MTAVQPFVPWDRWLPPAPATVFGELTADGQDIILVGQGDDHQLEQIRARLAMLTPLITPVDTDGNPVRQGDWGRYTDAVNVPATWATVVELGFSFNGFPGFSWEPQQRLNDWIAEEIIRRTELVPPLPDDLLPPWVTRTPRAYQNEGAARIAAEGKFLLLDEMGPQPETTPVWTPAGWSELGSLVPGDTVYDSDGRPAKVREIKYFGQQPVYRVTFSDGSSTLATGSHRWHVWTVNDRHRDTGGRVMTTDQLRESGLHNARRFAKFYLPQQPVIRGGEPRGVQYQLPLDPYAYGALLGNGCLGTRSRGRLSLSITGPDSEVLFCVGTAARELGTTYRWARPANRCQLLAFHRNGSLETVLTDLGACVHSPDKFVHPDYLRAGAGVRSAVLAGLLDTDGNATKASAGVEFSSASAQLAADVAFLARSLGAVVTEAKPQPAGYVREDGIKVQCLLKHRLYMRFPADGPNPFLLKRKADAWAVQAARVQRRNPPRTFTSIEPAGLADVCCIGLDEHSTHVYLTDTALIPTHNTGKSITALLGLEARRRAGIEIFPLVIVVPSWEVGQAWIDELEKWELPWPDPVIHRGPKRFGKVPRPRGQAPGDSVFITTYATLRRDAADMRGPLVRLRPAAVIADEIHLANNGEAAQTKALGRVAKNAVTIVGASGTAITRNTGDAHPLLDLIMPRAVPDKNRFKDRFCAKIDLEGYGERITGLNPAAMEEFFAIFGRQMRRVAKADVLSELPPKVYSVRKPDIPDEWAKAYTTMEEDMLARLPDGSELPAMTVLLQFMRLSQLASSAADVIMTMKYDEMLGMEVPHYDVTLRAPSWKAESLMGIIAERQHAPVVCFTASRQLAMIAGREYCEKAGLRTGYIVGLGDGITSRTRQRAIEDFQAGKLDVIMCTAKAGGQGITLTRSDTVVFLQRDLRLNDGTQPEDRAHRPGSEIHESIHIIDVVARGTVEDRVRQLLREKAGMFAEFAGDRRIVTQVLGGIR